jgi:hypothetical protein
MQRRSLIFETLDDSVDEATHLLSSGYVRGGNWSLGQACHLIRLTVDASVDGYPKWMSIALPIRPILRWLMLPRFLQGNSPAGIKTAGTYVPPENLDDAEEVQKLADSIRRFKAHPGRYHPHPGFGQLGREGLEHFHAMHAAHHFGFLSPSKENPKQ